jgi:hypothetical protein
MADANAGTNLIGITPDELIPNPHDLVLRHGVPETIAGWKRWPTGS